MRPHHELQSPVEGFLDMGLARRLRSEKGNTEPHGPRGPGGGIP